VDVDDDHLPTLTPHEFGGTFLAHSPVVSYNSSLLVEPYRLGWSGLYDEPLAHLYWIVTYPGVVRAWGLHDHTVDRYSAVLGVVEVALYDGRADSSTAGKFSVVRLDGESGDGLLIPPGVWHTFRAVSETVVLMNSKTPPYNAVKVDKQLAPLPAPLLDFSWPE
jgi:dTDP-4-dehydrorhamnose 3,5-epimerase